MNPIRVALYGGNGHQLYRKAERGGKSVLVAAACLPEHVLEAIPAYQQGRLRICDSLDALLQDPEIDLISLCSPRREDQAKDAIRALRAGKHVYAEKPAALSEAELDEILAVAKACGREFHEMATTAFESTFYPLKRFLEDRPIGEIIQVYVQKSYRSQFATRPQDEETDGGLIRWVGIHAMRAIEHVAGVRIKEVTAVETHLGNPVENGGLFTASSWMMTLENGGVASACVNYLNPTGFPKHGNETLRVFGTEGMAEMTDGGARFHVYRNDGTEEELEPVPAPDFFVMYLDHLLEGKPMPFTQEEEFHPLRIVIRAKEGAKQTAVR